MQCFRFPCFLPGDSYLPHASYFRVENDCLVVSICGFVVKSGSLTDTVEASNDLPVSIENISSSLIAYPNPASKPVTFEFRINKSSKATLDLFSASGQLVATIFNRYIEAGDVQKVNFSNSLAPGTYVYTLRWSDQKITSKLIITNELKIRFVLLKSTQYQPSIKNYQK